MKPWQMVMVAMARCYPEKGWPSLNARGEGAIPPSCIKYTHDVGLPDGNGTCTSSGTGCAFTSKLLKEVPSTQSSHFTSKQHTYDLFALFSHVLLYQQKYSSSLEQAVKSTCTKRFCTSEDSHHLPGSSSRERRVIQLSWLTWISATSNTCKQNTREHIVSWKSLAVIFP